MRDFRLVRFTVPFVRGKSRPRFTKTGRVYPDKKDITHEKAIAQAFADAARAKYGDGAFARKGVPVVVRIVCERKLPNSRPKRVTSEHDLGKPDMDNVAKLVLDALNGVAYEDDTQVVRLVVAKLDRVRRDSDSMRVSVAWWDQGKEGE